MTAGGHHEDWRGPLLAGVPMGSAPGSAPASVSWGATSVAGHPVVLAVWDFRVAGGSFGERDATSFVEAAAYAVRSARPLIALVRSGGTRLPEGIPALVGMARATLAREQLADAGVPLIAVADQPTTGGVFVTVVSRADVRAGVSGATVGFAGPRVVQAVTGTPPGPGSHTADSAYGAGLLDAAVPGREVAAWLGRALDALSGRPDLPPAPGESCSPAPRGLDPWDQVLAARSPGRPSAGELLDRLLADPVALRASRGDGSVRAAVGRVSGGGSVGVALAAARGGRPTPDGFRLLTRAARLADRLDLPLLTLVDTPGAEPGPASEADGLAGALAGALAAVLACRSPTLGVLVGEGGSGGALAGLVCDLVLATPSSYFAALVPEGAAAALRSTPEEAAAVLGLRPEDSLHAGVLDGLVPEADTPAFADRVAEALATLAAKADALRRAARAARWSGAGGLG